MIRFCIKFCIYQPHLDILSPAWNPYLHKDIKLLEKFALRLITQKWNTGYYELLDIRTCYSITRNKTADYPVYALYKFVHGLHSFPPDIVALRSTTASKTTICTPFAHTNALFLPTCHMDLLPYFSSSSLSVLWNDGPHSQFLSSKRSCSCMQQLFWDTVFTKDHLGPLIIGLWALPRHAATRQT